MKRLLKILAALLVIGVLGSCNLVVGPNEPAGGGGDSGGILTISFGEGRSGNSRAITSGADLPGDVLAGMRYDLILTGPNNETIERTVSGGETLSLTVTAGQWRIDSQGYYLDVLAGTGSVTVTVLGGNNPVRVPMMMSGPCYEVNADPGIAHGAVQPNFALAFEGTPITLTATPDSDSVLKAGAVTYNDGSDHAIAAYAFVLPASDVTVSAEFIQFVRYARADGTGDGASWANASSDIQKAMDELAAIPASDYAGPRIVKAAAGIYKPKYKPNSDGTIDPATAANDRDSVFILRQGVQVWGGYPASGGDDPSRNPSAYITTLSGDFNGDDNWSTYTNLGENAYHVVLGLDIPAGSGTVLDGLTITGGNANATGGITVKGYSISQRHGGGLYNHNSAPSLTNVVLSSSWAGASSNGGGGGMYNYQSSPALAGVTISGNISIEGGGMHNDASSPVLDHVVITGNGNGTGGGIYNKNGSSPALTNVTISGNEAGEGPSLGGGGMYNTGSSPVLVNVTISSNTANSKNGGGMYNANASKPVLVNVTISGNTAASGTSVGGGMYNNNSSPVLTNVTIAGNYAGMEGGAMWNGSSSTPRIWNSIVWGNTVPDPTHGPGIKNNSVTPVIAYSIVQGLTSTSDGNVADPGSSPFVSWQDPGSVTMPNSGGDYSLNGSAGVNAGDNGLYPANADDTSVFPSGLSAAAKTAINAALAKDLVGVNRKNGPIDMGAYEKN